MVHHGSQAQMCGEATEIAGNALFRVRLSTKPQKPHLLEKLGDTMKVAAGPLSLQLAIWICPRRQIATLLWKKE